MPSSPRIAVCAAQIPMVRGGAEILAETLCGELERRGYRTALVKVPSDWQTRRQILESCVAWRLLDLDAAAGGPVDLAIATRFPSYIVRHPRKSVWLVHQLRQIYDQLGTPFSDFRPSDPTDRGVIEAVQGIDRRTLGEADALYTIARNVSNRLERFNGLEAPALYPPPQHDGRYRTDGYGDFVLGVGRLDAAKRFDLLVRALAACRSGLRAVIAGTGAERERLVALARQEGIEDRLDFAGWVDDERLLDLYATCRSVYYAPFDEDYGYVTVEAFKSRKPVVTCADSGAVLELVEDGVNGLVAAAPRPRAIAAALDRLAADEDLARQMGQRGEERVAGIGWDAVIEALTAPLRHEEKQKDRVRRVGIPEGERDSLPTRDTPGTVRIPGRRLRVAFASPLPPQRSGISDYSAELVPHLARHLDTLDLFTEADTGKGDRKGLGGLSVFPLRELPRRAADSAAGYDLVVYQLGNNAKYHEAIWRLMQEIPGVVVLHETMLHHLVREMTLVRGDLDAYYEEHRYCYGREAERRARAAVDTGQSLDPWRYPLFERAVDVSLGVIVHNETARSRVLASRPGTPIATVPLSYSASSMSDSKTVDRGTVCRRLGVPEDALLIGSFGHITPTKRLEVGLRAFARLHERYPRAVYVLAGEVSPYYDLDRLVPAALRPSVVATGRLPFTELLEAMAICDVAINLRHPTGGETSAVLIRLLGLGRATVVSDSGSFREIPDGCCARVALDEMEEEMLAAFLIGLAEDPELRRRMGDNARRFIAEHHTLEGAAAQYAAFLGQVAERAAVDRAAGRERPRPVPPLAPWPEHDVLTDLAAGVAARAAELDAEPEELQRVAEAMVDLGLGAA